MLKAKINIYQIDYERSFMELFPAMVKKLEKRTPKNPAVRLLKKMEEESLTIALGILNVLDESTKREVFCSLIHLHGQDISVKINEALARHELGKNIQISGISLLQEGENLVLLAEKVSVNYQGFLSNTQIQQKINQAAGRKAQGFGGLVQQFAENNAGFFIKTAVSMLPEETERMALTLLQKIENKQQVMDLVEKGLQQKGIWMKLGGMQFSYAEDEENKEADFVDQVIREESEEKHWISEELEEKLLDAVAEYMQSLLKKEEK